MVKETVQSLKAENDKLKEKVDTVHDTLLRILSEENDHYIDLPDLITKISENSASYICNVHDCKLN